MLCSLLLVRKLAAWQEDVLSLPAGAPESSLIYLQDLLSSRRFLIDSGDSVSVFMASPLTSSSGVWLVTADGSSLTCSGSRIIPLRFGSNRFDWLFQLAHCLLLDVSNQCVFCPASPGSPEISLPSSAPSLPSGLRSFLLSNPQHISDHLSEFPDVLSSNGFYGLQTLPSDSTPSSDSAWSSCVC